ncbi:PAS domain S-box protein [Noviherbaspirillum sp. UKPF54]|uniref:bifunctional diguanylate cyclase/phosphodiesterase n=1 Tax=Noviherbaspirillum sp. UKPF54 TaxID=2601898 RepID=UPI0011B19E9C|nr:PAS domain S-box protein [Noviherbaspirillum sp. UKPF54]QDZ30024.1 PAS domain S-box protein [Noviherbaspirillum sp. UKPF54]
METHILVGQIKRLSKIFAGITAMLGASIAVTRLYLFGVAVEPQFPHAVASVCFMLCGAAVYLRHRDERSTAVASGLAAAVLSIAVLTIAYYLSIGTPTALTKIAVMPPNTAAALLLLSLAILLLPGRPRSVLAAQVFAAGGLGMAVLVMVGHAFGVIALIQVGANMPMTVGVSVLLLLLSLAVLFARPDAGLMRVVASPGAGGILARRLLSPAVATPVLSAWLTYQWQQNSAHGIAFVLAVAAAGAALLLLIFTWAQAMALDRYDAARMHRKSELARIEDNLRLLVQTVRDYAIFRLAPDGHIASWNTGAQHILGYPADDIVGASFERLFAREEVQSGVPAQMLETARNHDHVSREHWSARQDGTMCYAHTTMTALHEGGELVGFVNVMQDISHSKHAAEERALLSSMLSTMPDAVIVIDEGGIIERANPAAERAFGYSMDELIGRNVKILMPSPHREQHDAYLTRYLRSGERHVLGINRELVAQRKDGTPFPIELMVSEMLVGGRRKFTGVARDITERKRTEEKLAQYDQRFRAVYDNAAVGIALMAPDMHLLYVNRKMTEIIGYSGEELTSRNVQDITHPDDIEIGREPYRKLLRGETDSILIEKRYRCRNGDTIWVDASISCVRDKNGEAAYAIAVIEDISARKAAEAAVLKSKQDLDVALEGADVHLWHLDCESRTLQYLDKLPAALGLVQDEVRNDIDFWLALIPPDDREQLAKLVHEVRHGSRDAVETELRMRTRDGQWKWMLVRARVLERNANGTPRHVTGTCLDITERKQSEQEMLQLAQHDTLTGLPNRALSYAFGERTLASARRDGLQSAVLFVDLDRFKPINDTYGHDAGDAVLREVARRLRGCVRADDMVGRLGGDEFLLVLGDVDGPRGAGRVAAQCIAALGQPCPYKELQLQVSSSIGIAMFPADGDDIFTLARNADAAMYHAKECGRDNFQFFTQELNERSASTLAMENRLRGGLRQDEFRLHYQPIVDLESGFVIGAEALLRWPGAGVTPDQFIPVAEYTGVIHQLGEWALNEACRQQRAWQANGLDALTMSVNVSPAQFRQEGFRATVAKAVAASGIDPDCLQLEITENALAKNAETAVDALRALRQIGVHVVLDDFGKDYSSLSNLKQLPVDAIKIDKDFIHDLDSDRGNMAITSAIIDLGRELGLQVIAEGIESQAVLDSLRARRCKAIQGFYVCEPVAGDEFEDWYRHRSGLVAA